MPPGRCRGQAAWASAGEAGFLRSDSGSATRSSLWPPGRRCLFSSSVQEHSLGCGHVLAWKCFALPRCLKVLFIIRTVCFINTVKMFEFTFIILSGNSAFQSFVLIGIVSFNFARALRTGTSLRNPWYERWGGMVEKRHVVYNKWDNKHNSCLPLPFPFPTS